MTAAPLPRRAVRYGIDGADWRLHSLGLHLRHSADGQGGVWLAGKCGAVWYPSWQAAERAVRAGTCPLLRIGNRP